MHFAVVQSRALVLSYPLSLRTRLEHEPNLEASKAS